MLFAAACLWYWIFAVKTGNFWIKLAVSAALLASASGYFTREEIPDLLRMRVIDLPVGLASAAILYAVFFVGNMVLIDLLPSAQAGIKAVYAPKSALPSRAAGALLLCLTALAEEVFWRGFVQRIVVRKTGIALGIALGVLFYAGVHAWSLNVPLILAAVVAGAVWAVQFQLTKSLPSVIVSHAVWSVSIFLLLPVA